MQPNLPAVSVDARAAGAWGEDAAAYERVRPGWPPAALDWLWAELGLGDGAVVLDLAAGTGKLTAALASRARVIAVEPLAGMRAQNPHDDVREGTAQAIPVEDGAVDAVFVGEAFHWFGNPEAIAEIRRVTDRLALLWNFETWQDEPWLPRLAEVLPTGVATHHPTPRGTWDALDVPVRQARFPHRHRVDDFGALVGTWSRVANLGDPAPVLARARALVPDPIELPYETLAVAARL